MRRSSPGYPSAVSFGPGPLSQTIKLLIGVNVAVFVATAILARTDLTFLPFTLSLQGSKVLAEPALGGGVLWHFQLWRLATYMFLHVELFHLLFNMLALWMFGTELERIWGTNYFLRYYLGTGIGAGALTVLCAIVLPSSLTGNLYNVPVIGASGAIYGLMLAYAMYFPDRQILMFLVFPMAMKYAIVLMGAIAFYASLTDNSGVANLTHLGGLLVGYIILRGAKLRPLSEAKYWYLRWKMNRVRKKFDVYQGGRSNDWNKRVH